MDESEERLLDEVADRTRNAAIAASRKGDGDWRHRFLTIAACLALVAFSASWLTFRRDQSMLERGEKALEAAMADARPSELRLSKAPYAPYRQRRGRVADAADGARALLEAAAAETGTIRALQMVGRARLVAGESSLALTALDLAQESSPDDVDILIDRSVAASILGKKDEASRGFLRVLERDPTQCEALFNLAVLADESGDVDLARNAWERFLEADRSSGWATEARRSLMRITGSAPRP